MSIAQHIAASFSMPQFVIDSYLADLTDADLFVRPGKDLNHIAWQLGHLIKSEHDHISQLEGHLGRSVNMPRLPDGFATRHSRETANSDAPEMFFDKHTYLDEMKRQRNATLANLTLLDDNVLQKESPASIRYLGPTIGCVFAGQISHWMMHAGQWAIIRRQLGKPPMF